MATYISLEAHQIQAEAHAAILSAAQKALANAAALRGAATRAQEALTLAKAATTDEKNKNADEATKEALRKAQDDAQKVADVTSAEAADAEEIAAALQRRVRAGAGCHTQESENTPVMTIMTMLFACIFVVIILVAVVIPQSPLLASLTSVDTARGFVTFLVTASASAIAFMLIYQAFAPESSSERFRMAREVFGALVGILGTIIGYYFGVPKQNDQQTSALELSARYEAASGSIQGTVKGGRPPHVLTLKADREAMKVEDKTVKINNDGSFKVPVGAVAADGCLILTVADGEGTQQVRSQVEIPVKKTESTSTGGDAANARPNQGTVTPPPPDGGKGPDGSHSAGPKKDEKKQPEVHAGEGGSRQAGGASSPGGGASAPANGGGQGVTPAAPSK